MIVRPPDSREKTCPSAHSAASHKGTSLSIVTTSRKLLALPEVIPHRAHPFSKRENKNPYSLEPYVAMKGLSYA